MAAAARSGIGHDLSLHDVGKTKAGAVDPERRSAGVRLGTGGHNGRDLCG